MAVVTIELEMEVDEDLGVITLPEVINYLENLIGIGRIREFRNLISNLQQVFENKKRENEAYIKSFEDFKIKVYQME